MDGYRYKAFISYSHANETWAAWLHRSLENYRIPTRIIQSHDIQRAQLKPLFRDQEELATSSSLTQSLQEALRDSEYMIVVCSPDAAVSKWVNQEIIEFREVHGSDRILCVVVDGEPPDCFPEALRDAEPLAADVRPSTDGRRGAKLRLVAALLNVRFDELIRRDATRRNRRLAALATASTTVTVAALALSLYAYMQREEAIEQREIARQEAETSESVVSYLVDVFDQSNPEINNGRDLPASELLQIGVDQLDSELAEEPLVKARLLNTMAEVYWRRDDIDQAGELAEQSIALRREMDATGTNGYFGAVNLLANVRHSQARYDEAEVLYQEAIDGQLSLHEEPDRDALIAMSNLGTLYDESGRLELALAQHDRVLEMKTSLLGEEDPSTLTSALNKAAALGRIRRYDESQAVLERAREVAGSAYGESHAITIALDENLAAVADMQGDYARSEEILTDVIARIRQMYGEQHTATLRAERNLGVLTRNLGKLDEAEIMLTSTLSSFRQQLGDDHPETMRTEAQLAVVWHQQRRFEEVALTLSVLVERQRAQLGQNHSAVIETTAFLGEALLELGRFSAAEPHLQQAFEACAELYGEDNAFTQQVQALLERARQGLQN